MARLSWQVNTGAALTLLVITHAAASLSNLRFPSPASCLVKSARKTQNRINPGRSREQQTRVLARLKRELTSD